MNKREQTDRLASIELENTPRWIADELIRLSERIDALEAERVPVPQEKAHIDAYVWHGCRRYSAMRGTVPLGPARTTMLVALSDARTKGEKPDVVYDKVRGVSTPINEWKEDGEYTL